MFIRTPRNSTNKNSGAEETYQWNHNTPDRRRPGTRKLSPEVLKIFILNLAEHEMFPDHKNYWHFNFYE